MTIIPVVLAGGSGTRLWPAARENAPKQFQSFDSTASMLSQTISRLAGDVRFAAPVVCCGSDHRDLLQRDLGDAATTALVFEPARRNTAPAVAAAATIIQASVGPDAMLAILPSDHGVQDAAAFRDVLARAATAAGSDRLAIIGVAPRHAETGYGYVELGAAIGGGAFAVKRFVEKPDQVAAEVFAADQAFVWNAGIVVATAARLLEEMALHCPALLAAARKAGLTARHTGNAYELDAQSFAAAPAISLDYALLEKSRNIVAVRGDFAWSDLGTWASLWSAQTPDAQGNVLSGSVRVEDSRGSYVTSDAGAIAAIGLDNMIVIQSGDATLIAPMSRAQDVGKLAAGLASDGSKTGRVHRPWGYMDYLREGDGFRVKHLVVTPGGATSLQLHNRRAEHMTVVSGTAQITRDAQVHSLSAGQSIDIPLGMRHRLENCGTEDVHLIEIWLGDDLKEDDIVRFEDRYGRC